MIPSVFAGATAVYSEIGAEISNQTATAHKSEISAQARSKLEKGNELFTWQIMSRIMWRIMWQLRNSRLVESGLAQFKSNWMIPFLFLWI